MKKQKVRKNAKLKKLPFVKINCKTSNFYMKLFNVSILHKKGVRCQHKKTLAQVEFPFHVLSEHHMKVKRVGKLLISKCCHFVKRKFLAIK